jgi:hypothetical protein
MKMFGEKMKAKWYVFRAQMKYWWLSQKKWQKALWIVLLVIWFGLLFSSIGRKSEIKASSEQVQTACQSPCDCTSPDSKTDFGEGVA